MIEAEVEELVRRLINDLPERCRTVFLLNRQEGLYTLYLRGRENGEKVDRKRVISSVSIW